MSELIGEFTVSHLLDVAKGVVEKKTSGSVLLDTNAEDRIPKFKLEGMDYRQNTMWLLFVARIVLALMNEFWFRLLMHS